MPHSVSLFVTTPNEEHAGDVFGKFSQIAAIERRVPKVHVSLSANSWTEDEDLATDMEGELYHDDQTLVKVRKAIRETLEEDPGRTRSSSVMTTEAIVNAILNEGILFRERPR